MHQELVLRALSLIRANLQCIVKNIYHKNDVSKATPCGNIGDISDPKLNWLLSSKFTIN
eukprot:m.1639754 g.1639754  ORF g.1639754 m.1639754 type:complete len:59 (-) comp37743_c0_seq1:1155-1331(-)